MAHVYGLGKGTVSNYIRHISCCLYKVLREDKSARVEWPDEEDRRIQEGLVSGFPKAVAFVDGTRTQTFQTR